MNLSFFNDNDAKLLAQAADPVLRKGEIARLRSSRRTTATGLALILIIVLFQILFRPSSTDSVGIYGLILLCFFGQFYELQNRLRLLLLAEQIYAQQNRPAVGMP